MKELGAKTLEELTEWTERHPLSAGSSASSKSDQKPTLTVHALQPEADPIAEDVVLHGDCRQVIPNLPDKLFRASITSPPYSEQRASQYDSISEADYPAFTVDWMDALRPKLTHDGSVLIVIRAHIRDGEVSDYVLRTRLAVRAAGWIECDEIIWHKPDAPPLGSLFRPRHSFENILWFAKSSRPFVDLLACGNHESTRTGGFVNRNRHGILHSCQNMNVRSGTSRISDVIRVPVAGTDRDSEHPALFPPGLSDFLVQSFSAEGDTIIDPFAGSGTTLLSAMRFNRHFVGIDTKQKYVENARRRTLQARSA